MVSYVKRRLFSVLLRPFLFFYSSPRFKVSTPPSPLDVLPEYLEVVWRSLASENAECPLLVKKASDTLVERLKDPKTYDNITKDFKYSTTPLYPVIYHKI